MLVNGQTPVISTYPFNSTSLMVVSTTIDGKEIIKYLNIDTEIEYINTSKQSTIGLVKSYNSIYDTTNNKIVEVPVGSFVKVFESDFEGTTVEVSIEGSDKNNINILYDATDVQRHTSITNADTFNSENESDIVVSGENTIILTPQSGVIDGLSFYFDENISITIETGNTLPRIDLVILEKNQTLSTVEIKVKRGTPSNSPVVPSVEQTKLGFYELPIFSVSVASEQTELDDSMITDLRPYKSNSENEYLNLTKDGIVQVGNLAEATSPYAIAIGYEAQATTATTGYNIAIGKSATANGNYSIAIGANTVSNATSTIIGHGAYYEPGYTCCTAVGYQAVAPAFGAALGYQAKATTMGASAIGGNSSAVYSNSTAIGYNTTVGGASRTQTAYAMYAVSFNATSDKRDKDDIEPLAINALDFINKIKPREYCWNERHWYICDERDEHREKVDNLKKQHIIDIEAIENEDIASAISEVYDESGNVINVDEIETAKKQLKDQIRVKVESLKIEQAAEVEKLESEFTTTLSNVERGTKHKGKRKHVGFVAQEIKEVLDEIGVDYAFFKDGTYNNEEDQMTLDYNQFVPILTNAIQELSAKNESLEARLASLESKLEALEK